MMPAAAWALAASLVAGGGLPVIHRLDPRLDALIPETAVVETLAGGFRWVEGPVWSPSEKALLFSDIPANSIFRWDGRRADLFLSPSGYSGSQTFAGREPGSNGLTIDPKGRLVLCEHGDRRITRLDPDGARTVLVDRYLGKRLNSPNDAVFDSKGNLYFTDPPFGLPRTFDDPARELPFSGVYRLTAGEGALDLLVDTLVAPNGIALSPDETILYVTDVDPARPAWLAYAIHPDGSLGPARLLYDASDWSRERPGGPDGIEVDRRGNLFGAGPGGVYVFAPDGSPLGWIELGTPAGNVAWGDDGHSLFIAADTSIYRVRTTTSGPIR